ncbi:MAG: spheroidene monooxygenase [Cyclobacteriaceae bacterium]|nr:spheroidene monooxygenase [Cyclobacteriaceae bacterium]
MQSPVVTISLMRFKGLRQKFWAFTMMQFAHKYLKNVDGMTFYKLMGTGAGKGFRIYADFSTYALLTVWKDQAQAENFLHNSILHKLYRTKSKEQYTIFMIPVKSHGKWSGTNPFKPDSAIAGDITAVITRATIATSQLLHFWRYVPGTSKSLEHSDGLIYTKGIGEWPVNQMATFSLWEDEKSMLAYAYKNKDHLRVVEKSREVKWFSEELFARFRPFKSEGTWGGKKLLPF